jgi:hypothetical protein
MRKILYLHGLESKQGGAKVEFLASKSSVYAPLMDYKTLNVSEFILSIGTPNLIIGSSMGGYIADIIGSRLGIDVLLFNPALHSRSLNIDYKYGISNYKRLVVLGELDNIIDSQKTKKLLSPDDIIISIPEMGHKTPLGVFIDIYNKYF